MIACSRVSALNWFSPNGRAIHLDGHIGAVLRCGRQRTGAIWIPGAWPVWRRLGRGRSGYDGRMRTPRGPAPRTSPPVVAMSWRGLVYVGAATLLFSTSPVLIHYADEFSPFVIAFGRMILAAIGVGVI